MNEQKEFQEWKPHSPADTASMYPMFEGLALCLAIFFIGIGLLKRYLKKSDIGGTRRLRLVERIPLSSKTSLILVECDGKSFLCPIGSERVGIQPLSHIQSLDSHESQVTDHSEFSQKLDQACVQADRSLLS